VSSRPLGAPSTIGELAASAGRIGSSSASRRAAAELRVVGEGQVDVHALQVRPAVAAAVEDAIEGPVDHIVLVRPQTHFGGRIHPRMHRRRHQARIQRREQAGRCARRPGTMRRAASSGGRAVRLELDDVQRELVRPCDRAALDVEIELAADRAAARPRSA
jgi:hypothetical protein